MPRQKYEDFVKLRLDEIKEWSRAGCTIEEIARALNVGYSTMCHYVNIHPELRVAITEPRKQGIPEVKKALYRKAVGFEYEEKKIYMKKDTDGKTYQYTEITKKQALPDINAIGMYLRNFDDSWRETDAFTQKFKEMEFELRKELAEAKNW